MESHLIKTKQANKNKQKNPKPTTTHKKTHKKRDMDQSIFSFFFSALVQSKVCRKMQWHHKQQNIMCAEALLKQSIQLALLIRSA